jgi:hypothetical protein
MLPAHPYRLSAPHGLWARRTQGYQATAGLYQLAGELASTSPQVKAGFRSIARLRGVDRVADAGGHITGLPSRLIGSPRAS